MNNVEEYIILILKLTTIINAILLGWTVKYYDNNKIILNKKINNLTNLDFNIHELIKKFIDT